MKFRVYFEVEGVVGIHNKIYMGVFRVSEYAVRATRAGRDRRWQPQHASISSDIAMDGKGHDLGGTEYTMHSMC